MIHISLFNFIIFIRWDLWFLRRLKSDNKLFQLLCITAVPITPVLALFKKWYFGRLLCKLVPFCQAVSGQFYSIYCLTKSYLATSDNFRLNIYMLFCALMDRENWRTYEWVFLNCEEVTHAYAFKHSSSAKINSSEEVEEEVEHHKHNYSPSLPIVYVAFEIENSCFWFIYDIETWEIGLKDEAREHLSTGKHA